MIRTLLERRRVSDNSIRAGGLSVCGRSGWGWPGQRIRHNFNMSIEFNLFEGFVAPRNQKADISFMAYRMFPSKEALCRHFLSFQYKMLVLAPSTHKKSTGTQSCCSRLLLHRMQCALCLVDSCIDCNLLNGCELPVVVTEKPTIRSMSLPP